MHDTTAVSRRFASLTAAAVFLSAWAAPATAQAVSPRPWGRISFFSNAGRIGTSDGSTIATNQVVTSISYELTANEGDGVEYAVDFRHSDELMSAGGTRVSVYDAFVGSRLSNGQIRVRAGQMWITDLGGLGSVAGGLVEYRPALASVPGRLRIGAFGGKEPETHHVGYVSGVSKFGGYVTLEGDRGRRHVVGYVHLRHGGFVERSVVSFTNFVPAGPVFVYQVAEVDLTGPAGQGTGGLTYFFVNARVAASDRVDLQGVFHRGRSIDARAITDDVINGRPIPSDRASGYLYESAGGRVTVEVLPRVRVHAGYTRDRNNLDSVPTGRLSLGVNASDVAGTGLDLTVSDSRFERPTGRFHSLYVSVGRQAGRFVYLSGDYSTSLSVVRFIGADGVAVETRPETRQFGGSAVVYLGRHVSLLVTGTLTRDAGYTDTRVLSGITYRFR